MSDQTPLDDAAVARLRRLGGEKLVREMIALFLDYAPKRIAAARAAEQSGDLHALAQAVHPLKSSAGNVGARAMMELATQIEKLAQDKQPGPIPPMLRQLEDSFTSAKPHLEQLGKEAAP